MHAYVAFTEISGTKYCVDYCELFYLPRRRRDRRLQKHVKVPFQSRLQDFASGTSPGRGTFLEICLFYMQIDGPNETPARLASRQVPKSLQPESF